MKRTPDRGKQRSAPRPHGSTASQGFARFFVDTLPRVLPVPVDENDRAKKLSASRNTFWTQIATAAAATNDAALRSVQAFGRRIMEDEKLAAEVRAALAEKNAGNNDRITFEYHPDGGISILDRPEIRKWFAEFFAQVHSDQATRRPIGLLHSHRASRPLAGIASNQVERHSGWLTDRRQHRELRQGGLSALWPRRRGERSNRLRRCGRLRTRLPVVARRQGSSHRHRRNPLFVLDEERHQH